MFIIVLGIAANKCDLYEKEEVSEMDARKFAGKVGASFEVTSAADGTNVNDAFKEIGRRYLNSSLPFNSYEREGSIRLDKDKVKSTQKCC